MKNLKWFHECDCIEELKAQFRKLAMAHHPDRGGRKEDMQEINGEYSRLFETLKDIHRSTREDGPRTYTATEKTTETPEEFIFIINELFKLDGLTVELTGRWIWIGGDTMKHKDRLKELGCKWSPKKKLWSFHHEDAAAMRYKGKKEWSMDKIRTFWGSETIEKEEGKKRLAIA